MNLREFVNLLEEKGRLQRVTKEVDPVYEVAALMEDADDRPLYLENVKGSILPCITNICSSRELVALGLECTPNEVLGKISKAVIESKTPDVKEAKGYKEIEASLEDHFADCPPCIAFVNTYKSTTRLCKDTLKSNDIPDAVKSRLKEFVDKNKNT